MNSFLFFSFFQRPLAIIQLPHLHIHSFVLQLDNGGWKQSHKSCSSLVCLKRWQSNHTLHHKLQALVDEIFLSKEMPESEAWSVVPSSSHIQWACCKEWKVEWETQIGMCPCSTSTSKTPWRCRSEGKWPSRYTSGQSNQHKWLVPLKI